MGLHAGPIFIDAVHEWPAAAARRVVVTARSLFIALVWALHPPDAAYFLIGAIATARR